MIYKIFREDNKMPIGIWIFLGIGIYIICALILYGYYDYNKYDIEGSKFRSVAFRIISVLAPLGVIAIIVRGIICVFVICIKWLLKCEN